VTPRSQNTSSLPIAKSPTGIAGLDQILEGGFPKGRPTLVCGGAGCGKTVLAMEFLINGATRHGEPGVFVAFEESDKEIVVNAASIDFGLSSLIKHKKILIDHIQIPRGVQEAGDYDLEGLFIRIEQLIDEVGAKRIVFDTIETLFSSFPNAGIIRGELKRLFDWLKEKKMTAVVTAETGDGKLTRYGVDEYVADCVIMLDHRVENQNSIRRLRVVKYRGSSHGTNEYPFLIGDKGILVLPLSSLRLDHKAPTRKVSTGIPRLDSMLSGRGFYRGTSILVSGGAGTGKSSLAAHFVQSACRHGERALYIGSEQSADEIIRNMRSIGIDLERWTKRGLLRIHCARPGTYGLEKHLVSLHDLTVTFDPSIVVVDPITNFASAGNHQEVKSMVTRLIDFFKSRQITAMFTSLTEGDSSPELTVIGISSQMDAWLLLRNLESNGERNRGLYILKARGLAHSNQIREFVLTDFGAQLLDVYVGPSGVLTGSARIAQAAQERAEAAERETQFRRKTEQLREKKRQLEAQIARLRKEFELESQQLSVDLKNMRSREQQLDRDRIDMSRARQADHSIERGRPNGTQALLNA